MMTKSKVSQRQMLKAIGNGVDVNETTCKEVMEMDVLKVSMSDHQFQTLSNLSNLVELPAFVSKFGRWIASPC